MLKMFSLSPAIVFFRLSKTPLRVEAGLSIETHLNLADVLPANESNGMLGV